MSSLLTKIENPPWEFSLYQSVNLQFSAQKDCLTWFSRALTIIYKSYQLPHPPPALQKIDFACHLCGDKKMKVLNRNFRQKDKTTDVLSFPLYEDLRKERPLLPHIFLGDIFLNIRQVARQSKIYRVTFEEEFLRMFFHGFLHLVGYDHELSPEEERLMESLQEDWLRQFVSMG